MVHAVVSPRRPSRDRADAPVGERRRPWVRRHKVLSALFLVVVLLTPVWWSLGSSLTNPGLGTTVSARFAEWLRGHGGGSLVTWAENTWYSHHPPPVGGKPAKGAIPLPVRGGQRGGQSAPATPPRPHLTPPT